MGFFSARFIRVYFVPGAVFQSVVVAGGYGTGRELVEYFTRYGPIGGYLGMGITVLCWALVLGLTFEYARLFRVYDYRSFFRHLIGRGWIAFEILFVLMFLIVLAVVASAAGALLRDVFNLPYGVGLVIMLTTVGVLTFYGREIVTKSLTIWTVILYSMFIIYFVASISQFGEGILEQLNNGETLRGWKLDGFKYANYNLSIVPVVLFATREIQTRKEAFTSGAIAGCICIIPAVLFHTTFIAGYPDILTEEIPVAWMINHLGIGFLLVMYMIGLFGTFIETGAGFIQGINERIDAFLYEKKGKRLSKPMRGLVAVVGISLSAGLATFGIIALIARGYGTISWGFFIVYVLPIITYGVYKIWRYNMVKSN